MSRDDSSYGPECWGQGSQASDGAIVGFDGSPAALLGRVGVPVRRELSGRTVVIRNKGDLESSRRRIVCLSDLLGKVQKPPQDPHELDEFYKKLRIVLGLDPGKALPDTEAMIRELEGMLEDVQDAVELAREGHFTGK